MFSRLKVSSIYNSYSFLLYLPNFLKYFILTLIYLSYS